MEIFTLSVGQGAMTIIRGPTEAIIVDTHIPTGGESRVVFVKAALAQILEGRKLAGLILTSFDLDHADPRGVAWVLGQYWPRWVLYPKYFKDSDAAAEVFRTIRSLEADRRYGRRPLERLSIRLDEMAERELHDLSPDFVVELFSPHPENMNCSNNCSIVAKVRDSWIYGYSYLITGDTESDRWEALARIFGEDLQAEVIEGPHHGSATGISKNALRVIRPRNVLVSAGYGNKYGHPHREAVDAYRKAGAEVFSTSTGKSYRTTHSLLTGVVTVPWAPSGR